MKNLILLLAFVFGTTLLTSRASQAGTVWTGGGVSADWGDADNWGGTLPTFGSATTLTFSTGSGFTSGTATTLQTNRAMHELQIGTTTDFSIGTSGETLLLTNLNHQSTTGTAQHTIDSNIALQANGTWTMAGTGGTRMRINGVISDGGNGYAIDLTTSGGARYLRLDGVNTYSGGTTLHGGALEVATSSAFGTGPIVFNDAVAIRSVGGALNFTNSVTFGEKTTFGNGNSPAVTFGGPITLSNDVSFNNTGQSATGVVTLDGDITETGGSRTLSAVFGNRTFAINGNNSYSGGTILSSAAASQIMTLLVGHNNALGTGQLTLGSPGGNIIQASVNGIVLSNDVDLSLDATKTLQIGGNGKTLTMRGTWSGTGGDVTVASGATLGGTGQLTGDVNFNSGSTLAPGASTGILALAGAVTLNSGVFLDMELQGDIAGSGYDQLQMNSGSIDLNDATLQITHNDFQANFGDVMLGIINNSTGVTLSGTFNNLANGDLAATINNRDYYVYYNADFSTLSLTGGNDVVLYAESLPVPEPASGLLLVGLFGLLARKKKTVRHRACI